MKIRLKRSNVLQDYGNGNEAKRPTAGQVEYGELAVNYNAADPAIFMEDSDGNIIRIAGDGAVGSSANSNLIAGDGLSETDNGDETATWDVVAQTGYGIEVEAAGLRIGDDWSNIPTLV